MNPTSYPRQSGESSTWTAIISFGIGSLLMAMYLLFPNNENLLIAGLFYVIVAVIVNVIVLVNLIILLIAKRDMREYFAIKILIVLSNIPIALGYLSVIF